MKTRETTLGEIADIKTGYVFRGRVQEDPAGNVRVIQNKDMAAGQVNLEGVATVSVPDRGTLGRVQRGDILLRSRGTAPDVALVGQEPEKDTILASPLMRIRITDPAVADPGYVAWLLGQEAAQEYLRGSSRGSTLPVITKSEVEKLPLVLPPAAYQQRVGEIAALSAEVQRLTHELADKEAAYVSALLNNQH